MELRGTMRINERGHLEIGGCDAVELARQYGTPLYVFDEAAVRERCRQYAETLAQLDGRSLAVYAGKAFLTLAMCRLVAEEGMGLDVVSGGELYTALKAGFPTERILFHGNNKSQEELTLALEAGVGRIVVDNLYELELLEQLAAARGVRPGILLRVTPGIEPHTHAYIQTGQIDSKFGIGIAGGLALAAVQRAASSVHVDFRGLHCHVGSQLLDFDTFELAVRLMFQFLAELKAQGIAVDELDLGGGLGIRYRSTDPLLTPAEYVRVLVRAVDREAAQHGLERPVLYVEPGRSIVGEAGTTLYTVGSIKEVPGVRKYVAVDGGMGDNPRVALYQAVYEAVVANKAALPARETVSIAGKCCESGDMLIWDLAVPPVAPGDILAVFCTGAYNYSMASNYNRLPRPAVVSVYNGHSELWVRRETYEDLLRCDVLPARMRVAEAQAG